MALSKENHNPRLLILSCDEEGDLKWSKQFVDKLRINGWRNIITTFEFPPGSEYFSMIENYIRSVDKLLIVLSESSEHKKSFMKAVNCSIRIILDNDIACDIIPVVLHANSHIPFALQDVEIFRDWQEQDDSKLLCALNKTPLEHALNSFTSSLVSLSVQEQMLRRLNKLTLPDDISTDILKMGQKIISHWGVRLYGNSLIVDMLKIQNTSSYNRICLYDLFLFSFPSDISNVRFMRLYNVKKFSFQAIFQNGQVYGDLEGIYHKIMAETIPSFQQFWYQYRRNGLCPTDNSDLAFKPLVEAKFAWHGNKIHSPIYENHQDRMKSLENFIVTNATAKYFIAFAGFYSIGVLDFVQCYNCGTCIRIQNLKYQEGFYFGKCPLNEKKMQVMKYICENSERLRELGLATFEDTETRLNSFKPLSENDMSYDINLLRKFVEAGFFYRGTREDTQCYACDLSLTRIKDYTNPAMIHINFSPDCPHMKKIEMESSESVDMNHNLHPYLELELNWRNKEMLPEINNTAASVDDATYSGFNND